MPPKGQTKPVAVVEDEWEDAEDTELDEDAEEVESDGDETEEVESDEEAETGYEGELDEAVATALNRNPRSNEIAYAAWLSENAGIDIGAEGVHAALSLYRVWKASESYVAYKEELKYNTEHKDEAIARRKLAKLAQRRAEVEAELEKIALARTAGAKAKAVAKAKAPVATKKAAAKAIVAAPAAKRGRPRKAVEIVPDIAEYEDDEDDF